MTKLMVYLWPLAPAMANLFLGYNENKWLESEEGKRVLFYKRYVDDIFCILQNENEAENFSEFLNTRHVNLEFTIETEKLNKLPFLDILIQKTESGLETSIYKKKTDTGLLTNFNSFISFA